MYYVIVIREDCTPGELHGPIVTWDEAIEQAVRLSGMDDTPELRERIEEFCPVSDDYIASPFVITAE